MSEGDETATEELEALLLGRKAQQVDGCCQRRRASQQVGDRAQCCPFPDKCRPSTLQIMIMKEL